MSTTYAPHEQRVMQEKTDLDEKRIKLRNFIEDTPKFYALHPEERGLLVNQLTAMNAYSAALGQRIARFVPQEQPHPAIAAMKPLDNDGKPAVSTVGFLTTQPPYVKLDLDSDKPLPTAQACDLSGDGSCEVCQ